MTRKLLTMSLFAAGLLALLLYLAQSDSVQADAPTAIAQLGTTAEDTAVVITMEATHLDTAPCTQLTFATAGVQGGTLGAITDLACGEAAAIPTAPCTVTEDCDTADVTFTPDADLFTVSSTLSAGIDSVQATIPLASTTAFAPSGRVRIGSEFIDYTGKTATDLTGATRGVAGSTAASHLIAAAVDQGQGFFTYTAAHGATPSPSVNVVITITAVDDPPVACSQPTTATDVLAGCATAAAVSTTPGTAVAITLTAVDKETCELTFATGALVGGTVGPVTSPASNCTSNLPAGDSTPHSDTATLTFTPAAGFVGNGSIAYTADDTSGPIGGSVTIAVNTQPTADDQAVNATQGATKTITLTGSDADSAHCQLTFAITTQPGNGILGGIVGNACVSGSPNTDSASVLYTPNPGFTGGDSVAFTVTDASTAANATSAAGTVTITVADGAPTGLTAVQADASADLTLTTAALGDDVPGATLTLATPGTYVVTGVFQFREQGSGDELQWAGGRLMVGTATQAGVATIRLLNNQAVSVQMQWVVTTTAVDTDVTLIARKSGGTGSSVVTSFDGNTRLVATGPLQ